MQELEVLIQAGILCCQQACVCLAQFQIPGSCFNLIYLRMVLDYTQDEVMKMNCEVQCYCGCYSRECSGKLVCAGACLNILASKKWIFIKHGESENPALSWIPKRVVLQEHRTKKNKIKSKTNVLKHLQPVFTSKASLVLKWRLIMTLRRSSECRSFTAWRSQV